MEKTQHTGLVAPGEAFAAPVLYLILILVVIVLWKLLLSFPLFQKTCHSKKRSFRWLFAVLGISSKLSNHKAEVSQQRPSKWRVTSKERRGFKQQRSSRFLDGLSQPPERRSVRYLLCDNADCKICDKAAEEAERLIYRRGPQQGSSRTRWPFSTASYTESPSLPGIWEENDHDDLLRSVSNPAPPSTSALQEPDRPISTYAPPSVPRSPAAEGREEKTFPMPSLPPDSFEGHQEFSSGKHKIGEKITSSSSASELSCSQSESYGETTDDSDTSSEYREAIFRILHKTTTLKRKKVGKTTQTNLIEQDQFTTVKISFLDESVINTLESHLVGKRVQHLMELPSIFLSSLRCFMPSAPSFPPQTCQHEIHVVPRLEPLFFLRAGTVKKLEHHLQKRIQSKHWKLLHKMQGALRCLTPPVPSKSAPEVHQQRPESTGVVTKMQRTSRSMKTEVLDLKTTTESQAKLKAHLEKKCLQVKWGSLPAMVSHARKVISQRGRNRALPKRIPPGRVSIQARNSLCLSLLGKADVVEMNIICKLLHHHWGLPTHYTQSLRMFCPRAPALPMPRSQKTGFIEEGGRVEPSFLPVGERKQLESHVLRKRLQHQWGLPGLAQRSLNEFLLPAPTSPAQRGAMFHGATEVRILMGISSFPFLSSETKPNLERHLRTKILQRRWGIPKRVFESLQAFLPAAPPQNETRQEDRETFALPESKGMKKQTPSTMRQRSCKRPAVSPGKPCPELSWDQKWQQLPRHLVKKALQIRLGMATPVVLHSYQLFSQAQKMEIPKAIPPGLRPPRPRSQHLRFVDQEALSRIELNTVHKNLSYRWGLPTIFSKFLAWLFHDVTTPAVTNHPRSESGRFVFSEKEIPFLAPQLREALEWHVKSKAMQHKWGLPGLVQKSLQHLLPPTPLHRLPNRRSTDVAISPATLPFLSHATRRELERNVQRRLIHQQWVLPKRALEATRVFCPKYGFGSRIGQEPWGTDSLPKQQRAKKSQEKTARATKQISKSQGRTQLMLQRHLVKKRLEIRLEILPPAIRASWSDASSFGGEPLPKMILPGHRFLLLRRSFLPFACRQDMDRVEMTVKRNHLASFWELGTRCVEALHRMTFKPLSQPVRQRASLSIGFDSSVNLLPEVDRDTLERHVLQKKIGHAWGLPILMQRSLQSFLGEPPSLTFLKMGNISVEIQVQEQFFLPQDVRSHLELHIQKMKLHRLWGLPGRVLESLKMLRPESKPRRPRQTASLDQKRISEKASQVRSSAVSVRKGGKMAPLHLSQRFPRVEAKSLERIRLHLSKKSLEMRLEVLPRVFRLSCQDASFPFRQPLPKRIDPGVQPLRPRTSSFSLGIRERNEIDLALQHRHIACLWGLGTRYVEALGGIAPRGPFPPLQRPACDFSEVSTQFLGGRTREGLECHIQRKRMQHFWGYPALVQRSIQGFMPESPIMPHLFKTTIEIRVLQVEFLSLPQHIRAHLEFHIQKIKMQRRWGLPGRVMDSLKLLFPSHSLRKDLPSTCETKAEFGSTEEKKSYGRELHTICTAPEKKDDLDHHLRRKCHQIHLPALPGPMIHYQGELSRTEGKYLPRLLHAGQKSPSSRNPSIFFLPPASRDAVELNVRHKHVAILWGVPEKHTEVHPQCSSIPIKQEKLQFQPRETPFLLKEPRELLERHAQQKRLHHFWGIPSIIQRSLNLLIHPLPISTHSPRGRGQEVRIREEDLSFVPGLVQKKLERSLKKMIIHGQWKLPKKLQKSLPSLLLSSTENKELQEEESTVESTLVYGPGEKRAESQKTMNADNPREKKSSKTLVKMFPKTSPLEPHAKAIPLCTCDQAARGHVQRKEEGFLQTAIARRVSKRTGSVEKDADEQQVLLTTRRQDARPDSAEKHQGQTIQNRTPKTKSPKGERVTTGFTKEAWDRLESHIRWKRLQHAWGVPAVVEKSLGAFAPRPPKPQTIKAPTVAGPPSEGRGWPETGSGAVQLLKSWAEEIVPHQHLPFLTTEMRSCLDSHKVIQDSLRALAAPQSDSPHGEGHKHHHQLYHHQHHECEIQLRSEPKEPQNQPTAWNRTKDKSTKKISQGHRVRTAEACTDLTAFVSPVVQVPFLPDEAWDTLEFHLLHKKIQHEWGLPSVALKCLNAFASFPPDTGKPTGERITKTHPWERRKVETTTQDLSFLPPDTKERLEAHVRNMTTKHRWEIPKRVQKSLRRFQAPRELSGYGHSFQTVWKERRAERQGTAFLPLGGKLAFLTDEAEGNLEAHIRQKKMHHLWGLPSAALKSLQAFAPFPPDEQKDTQSPSERVTREGHREVQTRVWHVSFLKEKTTEDLEAHTRRRTAQRRWGLPTRVQQSLRVFLPPGAPSKMELCQTQPRLPSPWKAFQVLPGHSQSEGDDSEGPPEEDETSRGEAEQEEIFPPEAQEAPATFEPRSFSPLEVALPFLTASAKSRLEFHIQHKKIQHGWSLPSAVMKSLLAFAPFPLGWQKHTQGTEERTKKPFRGTAEVKIVTQRMSFLHFEIKETLDAHVRHMVAEHRWDLPKRVQQSLKAFLPPRTPALSNLDHIQFLIPDRAGQTPGTPSLKEDGREHLLKGDRPKRGRMEEQERKPDPKRPFIRTSPLHAAGTLFSWPEGKLPFMTKEAWNYLEFHIQQKKLQHTWGLPSSVLKSLGAFSSCFLESSKGPPASKERRRAHKRVWERGEVSVITENPPNLGPHTKERLEAHLRRRTAEHRWGFPKHAKETLRAFGLPAPPFHLGETNLPTQSQDSRAQAIELLRSQLESSFKEFQGRRGTLEEPEEKTIPAKTPPAISTTTRANGRNWEAELPFVAHRAQEGLEFHIQGKKIEEGGNEDKEEDHWAYGLLDPETSDAPLQTDTESLSGPEDPRVYHSELFHDVLRDRETASWWVAEEPTFCPVTKTQHSQAIQERNWSAGRDVSPKHALQKESVLNLHPKKTVPTLRPTVPRPVEPETDFLPQSSLRKGRSFSTASPWSEAPKGSERKRYPSSTSAQRSQGRKTHSKISLQKKKKTRWPREYTFHTRTTKTPTPRRPEESLSLEDSDMGWESVGSCKVFRCPCACHSSPSRGGSVSSMQSVAEEKKNQEEADGKAKGPEESSSPLFSKDRETPDSGSAKQGEEGSSLPSQDNGPRNSGSTNDFSSLPSGDNEILPSGSSKELEEGSCSLPSEDNEGHTSSSAGGVESAFSSLPSQHDGFYRSHRANKAQEGFCTSLRSIDCESLHSGSSLGEAQTEQETSEGRYQLLDKDAVEQYNTLAWDSSMQSSHVVESNSSYEDIVARRYYQRPRKQKTKLESRLRRKRSHLDGRTNSCHSLGDTAIQSGPRLQATYRGEQLQPLTHESRSEQCQSPEPSQFPQETENPKDHAMHQPQNVQPAEAKKRKAERLMPPVNHGPSQVCRPSRGREDPRSEEGEPEEPMGEGPHPQNVEDAEAKKTMALISRTVERKLHLQEGLELWKRNGGTSKDPWKEKHGVFQKERGASASVEGSRITKGEEVLNVEEGQPKKPIGGGRVDDAEAKKTMALISRTVERKLHLQEGLELWRWNGGTSKDPWKEKHGVFQKERGASAAVPKAKILGNGSEGEGTTVGEASTTKSETGDHPILKKQKEKRCQASEASLKEQGAGSMPSIKDGVHQGCRTTSGREYPWSEEGQHMGHNKERHPPEKAGRVDGKERTSILGRAFGRKLPLFDRLKMWNWKKVPLQNEKTQKST